MKPAQVSELELLRSAQAGDPQAFGELVLATQTFAFNLALRSVGDPVEAQDLVQEAYLRAWRALGHFRADSNFRTWLYRIVINLCLNRAQGIKRELAQLEIEDEGVVFLPDHSLGLQHALETTEMRRRIDLEIERLPASLRLLVMLRYQENLSYNEIASVMEIPIGTVKTGLFRAHARLRAALQDVVVPHEEACYV